MGLIKWDFFLGTIAPPRSSKHVPTPIWVREKNGRHLVKIENTYKKRYFKKRHFKRKYLKKEWLIQLMTQPHKRYSKQ